MNPIGTNREISSSPLNGIGVPIALMSVHAKIGPPGWSLSSHVWPKRSGPPRPPTAAMPGRGSSAPFASRIEGGMARTAARAAAIPPGAKADAGGGGAASMEKSRDPSPTFRIVIDWSAVRPVRSVCDSEVGATSTSGAPPVAPLATFDNPETLPNSSTTLRAT